MLNSNMYTIKFSYSYGEELSKEFSEWLAIIKNKGKKVYNLPNEFNILKAPKNLDDIQLTPDMQRYLNSKVDVQKFFKDSEAFRKDVELFKDIHNALMDQFDQKRREIGYMVNRKINNIVNSNICDN